MGSEAFSGEIVPFTSTCSMTPFSIALSREGPLPKVSFGDSTCVSLGEKDLLELRVGQEAQRAQLARRLILYSSIQLQLLRRWLRIRKVPK